MANVTNRPYPSRRSHTSRGVTSVDSTLRGNLERCTTIIVAKLILSVPRTLKKHLCRGDKGSVCMGRAPHSYARPLSRGVVIMERRSAPGYAGRKLA